MDNRSPIPSRAVPASPETTISARDVYYILFRHKWKITLCALAGIITGTAFYFYHSPPFQSETKLFIRYVVSEGRSLTPTGADEIRKSPDLRGETIMDSETEILMSFDLAKQVAEAVGAEKILAKAGGGKDVSEAAGVVQRGLTVQIPPRSSVIRITFKHPDAEIIQPVLRELVERYYKKHQEIHRTAGMMNEFMAQETDMLKARLQQTEEALLKARTKAEFISLEDAKTSNSARINHLREQIGDARADLAEKQAAYDMLSKRVASASPQPSEKAAAEEPAAGMPPPEAIEAYQEIHTKVVNLQAREQQLLTTYTKDNEQVKEVRMALQAAKQAKREIEGKYPQFVQSAAPAAAGTATSMASSAPAVDLASAAAHIAALQSRINELNQQYESVKKDVAAVDQMELQILDLMRRKEMDEKQYMLYQQSLEQARIRDALGAGKVTNISQIQQPPPPFVDRSKTEKTAGMAMAGGIIFGLGWAFLIEMLLDRSVRRPVEFERSLGLQLFLSVPEDKKLRLGQRKKRLSLKTSGKSKTGSTAESELLMSFDEHEGLRPFHETLRDRLIGYFERRNLIHKPKLIAVTGIGSGSGVTTTAAGLARALSETGDGHVLLVDMTPGQGAAQQFSRGEAVCGLESMLATRENNTPVQDNLYIVAENTNGDKLSRILPQRFSKLLPKLKSSDFDYIIFDMPPVSQISITPRLAEFMDMVLLVVESEKTDRETVQRAAALLAETKAHVGALLNKTRSYVPSWLHQEHMGSV